MVHPFLYLKKPVLFFALRYSAGSKETLIYRREQGKSLDAWVEGLDMAKQEILGVLMKHAAIKNYGSGESLHVFYIMFVFLKLSVSLLSPVFK